VLALRGGKTASRELLAEITAAASERRKWATASGGKNVPIAVNDAGKHLGHLRRLAEEVQALAVVLPAKRLSQSSIDELRELIASLDADQRTPFQIPKVTQIETSLEAAGVEKLVGEIKERKPSPLKFYKADEAWVVTNSSFTPSARSLAQANNVRLFDGYDLKNSAHLVQKISQP
jgi:hypothetical protein